MRLAKLKKKISLNSYDVAIISISSAILITAQLSLAAIPNVELVSLLILLYGIHLYHKTIYIIYIFVFLEGLIFGFSIWWISYLYIWLILYIVVHIFRKLDSPILWALILSIYGLVFGALTSIPYLFIGGPSAMLAYIVAGVSFDITHCISNFILTFVLFRPLNNFFLSKISN